MPPRPRNDNLVRGPNSALTAFLREQGINANVIRERHLLRLNSPLDAEEEQEQGQEVVEIDEDELDEEEEELRLLAREKRRRLNNNSDVESDSGSETPRKTLPGETINCIECSTRFKVSVYTKNFIKNGQKGYLCDECNELNKIKLKNMKKNQLKLRKKRQLIAKSLLDQKDFNISKLQDMCIKLISANIDNVESLGDIGSVNYNKLSKILSKNRSLNNKTISLFLMSNLSVLEFWDCSTIDADNYDKMIAYCPALTSLTLSMCGQLNNKNLLNLTSLPNLTEVDLNGAFLINENSWLQFFEMMLDRLKSFKLNNTHRFNNQCMQSLLTNCPNLSKLSLKRLDTLNDPLSYELIPHYLKNLTSLEISYPLCEILDQTVLNILQESQLETLALENCVYLTDESFQGLLQYGGNLQNLTITNSNITNAGFYQVFNNWELNHGLMELNLYNNLNIQDDSMLAILQHSKNSLINLNLNSCKSLTRDFWANFPKMPLLTILDCGFVRSFDNKALRKVIKQCENLTIIEVYGNNKCNDTDIVKTGLKIIGRERDTI